MSNPVLRMISWRSCVIGVLSMGALLLPSPAWSQVPRIRSSSNPSPFAGGITAEGRIVPAGGVVRVSAPAGVTGQAIVENLLVKQGETVEVGQLLAVLRGRSVLQAQVDAAERDKAAAVSALEQAQASQKRALDELNLQLSDLEGRAALADVAVRRASSSSALVLAQAKREQAAAQAAFDNTKLLQPSALAATAATVATAQATLDAIPKSRTSERNIASAQLEEAKAAKARADLDFSNQISQLQAQVELSVIHTKQAEAALITEPPTDPANLSPEQVQARAAHDAVDAQKKLLASAIAEGVANTAAAQAHIAAAEAATAVARSQLALSEVRAPSSGVILAILARPGEAVGPGGLLQMGDTREMYADALVYIDDVPSIRIGQRTMITGSALPDEGITGQVVDISPMVAGNTLPNPDPTVFSDQPVVQVKVKLDSILPAAHLINGQVTVKFAP